MLNHIGFYTQGREGNRMVFTRRSDGEDWNAMLMRDIGFDDRGEPTRLPPFPWLTVRDGVVQNVEVDPSRLMPIDCDVYTTDQAVAPGMVLVDGVIQGPPHVPSITEVSPADLWRRATDAEAEAIDRLKARFPLRLQRIFDTAQIYRSTDEYWPALMGAAVQEFGEARAAELLASSQ